MHSNPLALNSANVAAMAIGHRNWSVKRAVFGRKPAPQKWLVPVDGSRESICAVEHVIAHAGVADAKVHLVNVQQPIMAGDVTLFMSAKAVADTRLAAGEEVVRAAGSLLDANHVEYTAEVVFGSPADAIVRCAAQRHCTKIVIGTKGRGAVGNLIARSVTSQVVRRSHVPVTLIKESGTAADLRAGGWRRADEARMRGVSEAANSSAETGKWIA